MVKVSSVPMKPQVAPVEDQGEAILALHSQGHSIRRIAHTLGVKKNQVEKVLNFGIVRP